jgi:hypothetical protein
LAFSLTFSLSSVAQAQDLRDRFNIRLSLQGMYLGETQAAPMDEKNQSPLTLQLGYGELRAVIDGRRLPGQFDAHLDARVRLTSDFSTQAATQGANQVIARGYLGGREYELRQAWVKRRGDVFDFALGRMIVPEADALKIDGLRAFVRFARHWELSLHAGAYPDPFSRSVLTDYVPAAFTFAGGGAVAYTYDRVWGSVSGTGAYLGGLDDGGPLNEAMPVAAGRTEGVRAYLTWTNYARIFSWLDLFNDLVVDVAGAAGVQVTRADVMASARLGRYFTLRAGYDHLSALAIEMYLTRLLNSRIDHVPGTIENNLTVQRTARNQGRLQADFSMGKVSVYAEGQLRQRALVDPRDDPQFAGVQVVPGLAYDLTVGLRDRGSLWSLRPGAWFSTIADYRATNYVLGLELGRNFYGDRLTIDAQFLYARTTDSQAPATMPPPPNCPLVPVTPLMGGMPNALTYCYGQRSGAEYEVGLTLTAQPWKHWFGVLDYRLVINDTDMVQSLYTNVLLLRVEARY